MSANNMRELEKMLAKEMRKAMREASDTMLKDMQDETADYYEGTDPKMYVRTYALKDTPKVSSLRRNGNEVEFDAYLDTSHKYTTGKNPTMEDVLYLANYGITNSSVGNLAPTIGKEGFWERAEEEMQKTLDRTMAKHFS